jgi:type II secretory pathway pseudopilin PulG
VELLVVIGVIGVLLALLLPSIGRAREQAKGVACASNQRQIMMAFLLFANDHNGHLPGNWFDGGNPDAEKRAWLRNSSDPFKNAPECGTIYRYLNSAAVYRCPSLEEGPLGSGVGSNGRFDYAAVIVFAGAKVSNIKPTSRFKYHDGRTEELPTPVICEEDSYSLNGKDVEGGHCSMDAMAHTHPGYGFRKVNDSGDYYSHVPKGGAYYATIDGSVHFFKVPWQHDCRNWYSRAPSGKWVGFVNLANWNWWGRQ